MKTIYEKIIILKVEILESVAPYDKKHHQTTMSVMKEMNPDEYSLIIDTINFLDKVKGFLEEEK